MTIAEYRALDRGDQIEMVLDYGKYQEDLNERDDLYQLYDFWVITRRRGRTFTQAIAFEEKPTEQQIAEDYPIE